MGEIQKAVAQFRQMQKLMNGGCSDGYCVIEKTKGMHTNGGCGCLHHPDFITLQRVGHMLRSAQIMASYLEATPEAPDMTRPGDTIHET